MNYFDPKNKQVELQNPNEIFITLDIDWAPDPVIEYSVELLESLNLSATIFATHTSPTISRLQSLNNFEVGIHPNFLNCENYSKHLDDMCELFPEAKSVRSHGLFSSSNIVNLYEKKGLKVCSDIFLPYSTNIRPFWRYDNRSLLSIPYYWEDGNYLLCKKFIIPDFEKLKSTNGIKIFNFHPIHLFVNSDTSSFYKELVKKNYHDVENLIKIRKDFGIRNFLEELADFIHLLQNKTRTIYELTKSKKLYVD
jgi:hypothetical protein